jgi:hypothetical protein
MRHDLPDAPAVGIHQFDCAGEYFIQDHAQVALTPLVTPMGN